MPQLSGDFVAEPPVFSSPCTLVLNLILLINERLQENAGNAGNPRSSWGDNLALWEKDIHPLLNFQPRATFKIHI